MLSVCWPQPCSSDPLRYLGQYFWLNKNSVNNIHAFPFEHTGLCYYFPSPSPAAMFYWRGNNTSTSNDGLEIRFKLFTSAVGFQFLLSAGILAPACFSQRDIAHCLSQDIWVSPALLLVSPLNNLINVHKVPNAPDGWVIPIQILQSFSVYPLLLLLSCWVAQVVGTHIVDIHPKEVSPWCFQWSRLMLLSVADDVLVKPQQISLLAVLLATSAQHIWHSCVALAAWDAAGGATTTALRLHMCLRAASPHK